MLMYNKYSVLHLTTVPKFGFDHRRGKKLEKVEIPLWLREPSLWHQASTAWALLVHSDSQEQSLHLFQAGFLIFAPRSSELIFEVSRVFMQSD